jgi:hypothetical protein
MTPEETAVFFFLLIIISALIGFITYRELSKKPDEQTGTSEIETMFDYNPGLPPPKSISDTSNVNQVGSQWSFLWG